MQGKALLRRHGAVLQALAMVAAVLLIFWAVNTPKLVGVSASRRELPVYCVQQDEKRVALSFDAAWGNEDTQTLIDILGGYGVAVTFYHSSSHAHFSSLTTAEIKSDISKCNDKIEAVTGVRPTLFRCPYGEYDDHVIKAVRALGMTPVQWDVDSLDWKGISAQEISRRVLDRVQPGSIVLFHNAAEHTPEALPEILEALLAEGYEIVPISEILLEGDFFIDGAGRQCRK